MADNITLFDNTALLTQRAIVGTTGLQTFTNTGGDTSFSIDSIDQNDYYKLTVSRSSNAVIKLQPQGGDLNLSLLEASGNDNDLVTTLTVTNNSNGLAEAIVTDSLMPLEAGRTYYIRVSGNSSLDTINYTLSVETSPTSRADLLWRDYTPNGSGTNGIWRMNGTSYVSAQSSGPPVGTTWVLEAAGDFNGDNSPDYLWHDHNTGTVGIWLMDSTGANIKSVIASLPRVSKDYYVGGLGDFNGDNNLDIVWRYAPTGSTGIWYMNQTTYMSVSAVDHLTEANWLIETVADFNLDGKPDFFYRNPTTGQNVFWLMDGTQFKSSESLLTMGGNWRMEGAGDFDGDGDLDLVWREYTQGTQGIWLMDQTTYLSAVALQTVGPTWAIAGVLTNALPADLAGNTTSSAFAIGLLDSAPSYGDFIGPADLNDHYSFTLDVASKIGVLANGASLSTNSALEVLSAAGTVVGTATANGTDELGLTGLLLDPGTYYVRIATTSTQEVFYNIVIGAEEQVLPVNLVFPGGTTPTFKDTSGVAINPPVFSINTPFTVDLNYSVTYGDRQLSEFEVGFYLSKDGTIDANDLQLDLNGDGVINGSDVAVITNTTPGTPINLTQRLTIPSKDSPYWNPAGDEKYNIIIVLDPNNKITEVNPQTLAPAEGDNVIAAPITIQEFLPVNLFFPANTTPTFKNTSGVTINPPVFSVNTPFTVDLNYSMTYGDRQLSAFEVGFYLSKDGIVGAGDLQLDLNGDGIINGSDIAVITNTTPGTPINLTQRLTIPSKDSAYWDAFGDGAYNIIIVLDPNNKITEVDPQTLAPAEGDNVLAAPITIRDARLPDLTGSVNVVETAVNKGGIINLSGLVQNIGLGVSDAQNPPGSQFEVTFYLSKNKTFSADDRRLSPFLEFGPLNPQQSVNFPVLPGTPVTATVPVNWSGYTNLDGIYYVLMVIDEFGTVNEVTNGAANNVVFDTIVIT